MRWEDWKSCDHEFDMLTKYCDRKAVQHVLLLEGCMEHYCDEHFPKEGHSARRGWERILSKDEILVHELMDS